MWSVEVQETIRGHIHKSDRKHHDQASLLRSRYLKVTDKRHGEQENGKVQGDVETCICVPKQPAVHAITFQHGLAPCKGDRITCEDVAADCPSTRCRNDCE